MEAYLQASADDRQRVRDTLARVLGDHPQVVVAFLFGSFLDQPRFRDIDVGILVDPRQVPESDAWSFASQLATDLELAIRYPVDLVILNYASIAVRYYASLGEVLVCKDAETRYLFLERAWDEYLDFEPFLRASLRDLLEGDQPPDKPAPG